MTCRRNLLGFASLTVLTIGPGMVQRAAAAIDSRAAMSFVKSTGDQLIAIINSNADNRQKRDQLARVMDASVDVDGIARFCLGRSWSRATPEQQQQFRQAFRAMLVTNISGRLGDYQGVRFTVGRAQQREDGDVVSTVIERPNNAPSQVQWLVSNIAGSPKIEDMITEGVSLRLTQRNDYESFLAQNGGNVGALVQALQRKAASQQAQ